MGYTVDQVKLDAILKESEYQEKLEKTMLGELYECINELYKERAYAYDDKIHSKGKDWNEAIQHYDNIGTNLSLIKDVLLRSNGLLDTACWKITTKKCVDIWALASCSNVEEYNSRFLKKSNCELFLLSEVEFNILKKGFKNNEQ